MTTVLAIGPAERDGLENPRRMLAVASVLAGMVLVVLDASIVNIALPTIAQSLQVTPSAAIGVVTAYQLGLVISLLPAAAFGESVGYRRIFATGAMLFTVASVLCAVAPSLELLIAARFFQGIGGASIMALGVALLRFTVAKGQLGAAIGWNAMAVALASAAGPTFGAVILAATSWHWLFAINLPIGIAVIAASRALPAVEGNHRPVDPWSIMLNACAFGGLVIGAEVVLTRPILATTLTLGGMAYAAALVQLEARRVSPLVPLDLLRVSAFRTSVIASVLCFAGVSAALVALPFHFQHTLGLSPLTTGLYLTPWPLAVALIGPLAGKWADRFSTAWICLIGGVALAFGLTGAALLPTTFGAWPLSFFAAVCGVGFGLFNVSNNRNMFMTAPRERSSAAGGLQSVARLSGQISGTLILTLLFSGLANAAPHASLALGASLSFAAGLMSVVRESRQSSA